MELILSIMLINGGFTIANWLHSLKCYIELILVIKKGGRVNPHALMKNI